MQAQRDDDRMTHQELLDSLALLIFGGFDTHPQPVGTCDQDVPGSSRSVETARRTPRARRYSRRGGHAGQPAVTWVTRRRSTTSVPGLAIKAGTTVHLFPESAGTDPRTVENPQFDITATGRPPHFGFGGGAHHCLGHFVARSDMSVALPILARRDARPPFGWRGGLDALSRQHQGQLVAAGFQRRSLITAHPKDCPEGSR